MLNFRTLKRRDKTEEEEKREAISRLATEQLRKIMNFGMGFPVIDYKYEV